MDGPFQYAVYFEGPMLDEEQRRKVEMYFNVRRKSAGGDCGSITVEHDKVYRIAFHKQDAQERVLQKSEHVLEFPGGPLVLTVRRTPGPSTGSPITSSTESKSVSPKLDSSSFQQTQPSSLTSTLQPSSEEYELQPDVFLLRYLKECPKAVKDLEEALTSVASSAQLYPEEGRALVSRLAQAGAGAAVRNWKTEVDKIFNGYMCHYELDPHKVKALLQADSSGQTIHGVKVYSEVGMAVVVGQPFQVNATLMAVEDSRVKRQSGYSEKQKTTRRLGEAKLRLLWEDMERSLQQDFPGVKVTQGAAGQLDLEGSAEEILKAQDCISEQENAVFESTVSDMSLYFWAFLRKAYGGPGMLGDFLGVRGKVEIELRDTEVRFFTLSADKLDDTEKKLHEKFQEVKIDVPNCSSVPSDLQEKLKSKTNEMNQGQYRVQVVFGTDSTVRLLGHAKEVEELSEVVIQFILDESSIEGVVILPYPELIQVLPEFLQLHGFDYSGVTFHPITSSSRPSVALEGPSGKVTEVRNKLGTFLTSLVQDTVTIDLAGAARYLESPTGRDNILSVAHSQKCLVQLQENHHATREEVNATEASYRLRDGFQVLVCQGDITKQEADALVNAANEDLDHGGGVAAALSKAGGPQVQKESRTLVKQNGKVATGGVVVTTGGNLKCKKLLHAVGPVGGKAGGRERILMEKCVQSALNLAEMMEFRSIAIPCISSGLFGVPVAVCADAIVTAVKEFASQGQRSLSRVILIDNRGEVVRAMKEACDRLLQGRSSGNAAPRDLGFQSEATCGAPEDGVHVEIIQGTIETQQVDCLVIPMVGHNPISTRVGKDLANVVGPHLTAKFHQEAGGATSPGDTVLVTGLSGHRSKRVFFLHLLPWDNNPRGVAIQALREGIRTILASCRSRGYSSVAFPVLGTGVALRFSHSTASKVFLEEIRQFEHNQVTRAAFLVRIVIHPNDKDSSKAFQSAQETLHLRGFTNDADPGKASFYRHVSRTDDEVTATLGGVKLQMVLGDITHESTDVIINTTDFSQQFGVSKAIVTAAGPSVQAQLAQVVMPADRMCTTGPGALGCKEIIHASFMSDPQIIRKNCKKILKQCESKGYISVAFPAINTGMGGMDSDKACKSMLDGMTSAISDLRPQSLRLIRIVILQHSVFYGFRAELAKRFGLTAARHLTLKEKAEQILKKFQDKRSKTSTTSTPQDKTFPSTKPPPAVVSVISCSADTINTIKRELEGILKKQLVEREVDVQDLSRLDGMELEAVQGKVRVLGISLEYKKDEGANGNRAGNASKAEGRNRSGSRREVCVLTGLKEDVLGVIELINRAIHKGLCQDLQDKEEAGVALQVQWSIQDANKAWLELSLHDNYMLEEAHQKKEVFVDLSPTDGTKLSVNLKTQEATNWLTGITCKVKRSESETALQLPTHWEPMHGEVNKKVMLDPNSPEYQTVANGFLKTAKYKIQKIERMQHTFLWKAYTLCRQRILEKNGLADLGEMSLYHGTSEESCNFIGQDRFNRSYAGQHAAKFGKGVYFAVNASYSAKSFSPADALGFKRLYVALVLTGRYTVGNELMNDTPLRGSNKTDRYDSLVDKQQQPNMFVIFRDDQAYPEYLITFN
ncbi:protein mono-ADP-ribosyltransferase PARP14-like isoform X2 [Clinocottus analis]|uniref:protein mono-ADP-ribosyltransferase PARP14-like isoform X2 n=1 Tax=Clinocottus analis TaxID=304258 RepID=UPI0035BFFFE5